MSADTALAFGALLGGAVVLDYGIKAFRNIGASSGTAIAAGPAPALPPGHGAGGSYTKTQLESLWIANGGNPAHAAMAAAIALAESGGDPHATDNDSNGTVDRGLWQINSVHGSQSTYDVNENAKAAVAISDNGTDWSAWVTFLTGAYRKYL